MSDETPDPTEGNLDLVPKLEEINWGATEDQTRENTWQFLLGFTNLTRDEWFLQDSDYQREKMLECFDLVLANINILKGSIKTPYELGVEFR